MKISKLLALVLILTNISKLEALEFSFKAGLDDETKELLDSLPSKYRKEAELFITRTLPRVEQSANNFLNNMDKKINSTMNEAFCNARATARGVLKDIKYQILWGEKPIPIKEISAEWRKLKDNLGSDSSPIYYMEQYGGFLANAAITSCEVSSSTRAMATIAEYQFDASQRWDAWKKLVGECNSPQECISKAKKMLSFEIKHADAKDVISTKAKYRLSEIDTPKDSLFRTISLNEYEERIIKIFDIYKELKLSPVQRKLTSSDLLDKVRQRQELIDEYLLALTYDFGNMCGEVNTLQTYKNNLENFPSQLNEALKIYPKHEVLEVELRNKIDRTRVQFNSQYTTFYSHYKKRRC